MTARKLVELLMTLPADTPIFVVYNDLDGVQSVLGLDATMMSNEELPHAILRLENAEQRGGC